MFRAAAVAATLLAAPAAHAATVTFNTLASYDAFLGTPSQIVETFTGNQINGTAISQILGSQLLAGNRLQNVAGLPNGVQFTTLVFSTAMTSFAAKVGNLGVGEMAYVLLDGVQAATLGSRATFFGLHSTKAFTSITFVDATRPLVNTQFNLDDIRATAVPLPAGAALVAGGLGAIGLARRRRRAA